MLLNDRERAEAVTDIARLILVGGPTMTPYLRQRLADAKDGLGIAVDHNDKVYVCDNANGRLQMFTRDGGFIGSFPVPIWDCRAIRYGSDSTRRPSGSTCVRAVEAAECHGRQVC